jgi:hypothetical protein
MYSFNRSQFLILFFSLGFAVWLFGRRLSQYQDFAAILILTLLLQLNLWIEGNHNTDRTVLEQLSPHLLFAWLASVFYLLDWNKPEFFWPFPTIYSLLLTTSVNVIYKLTIKKVFKKVD